MDIAVEEDQLALAIGRGGQNIKLASRLTGWKLNVMSISDADDIQAKELQKTGEKLAEKLGVDAEVAAVLIDEGYTNLDEIAEAESDALSKIEEFDSDMVGELQERAQDAQLVKALTDAESTEILLSVEGVDEALAAALVEAEITTVDALAELSIVEVLEIQDVGNDSASAVIMAAREKEGWFD
jgi:N utilization substance protein A